MKQTLLAILAMMLATTFAYQNQVKYVDTAMDLIHGEMLEMGGAVGVETLEVIRARAFDEALLEDPQAGVDDFAYNNSDEHFPTGRACEPFDTGTDECEAIEHFHKMQTATVPFVISQDTFYFAVDVEVEYVDENNDRHDGPTEKKRVTVYVQDTWPGADLDPYIEEPIRLERIFTY